jgi:phosphorylcholine metabolism protein LicD
MTKEKSILVLGTVPNEKDIHFFLKKSLLVLGTVPKQKDKFISFSLLFKFYCETVFKTIQELAKIKKNYTQVPPGCSTIHT